MSAAGPSQGAHCSGARSAEGSSASARAGIVRRLLALLYEGLLLVALLLIAGFALAPFVSPSGSATSHTVGMPTTPARVGAFVALALLGAIFYGWSWSEGRRTLPMKTWHLALATRDRAPVPRRTALVRYVAWWIGPALGLVTYATLRPHGLGAIALPLLLLNYLAAFVDPERQFLHDRVAGTRVVTG
jgi:uncharacterized RDD family membrane protein YckC